MYKRQDLPPSDEHTWRAGLDRLLLGHAMDGDGLDEVLPLPAGSSELAQAIGALAELLRRLRDLQAELIGPHPPAEWTRRLLAALTLFEAVDEDEADTLALLRDALLRLAQEARAGGCAVPLARATIKAQLGSLLDEAGPARAFITGALTCCALSPMRRYRSGWCACWVWATGSFRAAGGRPSSIAWPTITGPATGWRATRIAT